MNIQEEPPKIIDGEVSGSFPDRQASALLKVGFVLFSLFGFFLSLNLLVAGRLPPLLFLMTLLGGITMLLGWRRKSSGSSISKLLFKSNYQRIQSGATAGVAAALLVYLVFQSGGLNIGWLVPFIILSIVWSLMFGIPAGGIGGLVLASIWKNKKAAYIGGAIGGTLLSTYWMWSYFGR